YALALLTALATSGAVRAHAGSSCVIGYPFKSSDPRTDVSFNESAVLRAFSPQQIVNATPGLSIKVWYNDEHALTLGVRRVIVQTKAGTTTTDYPVSALSTNPGSVLNPQVGTMTLDGDQAGTDTSACSGYPDLCDRPMFPALFITDITTNPTSTAGDWQHGGTPIPPHAVFGTWQGAVRPVNKTRAPALITVRPPDPLPGGLLRLGLVQSRPHRRLQALHDGHRLRRPERLHHRLLRRRRLPQQPDHSRVHGLRPVPHGGHLRSRDGRLHQSRPGRRHALHRRQRVHADRRLCGRRLCGNEPRSVHGL